jgi:RNA polymerase sigma-70 factor (ECF subfamily)
MEPNPFTTSPTLLRRVKSNGPEAIAAWKELVELYRPFIIRWLKTYIFGSRYEEEDLIQEVWVVVGKELPAFERERTGSFRAWLKKVIFFRACDFGKARQKQLVAGRGDDGSNDLLAELEDPNSRLSRQWDVDYARHTIQKLADQIRPRVEAQTWQAFVLYVLQEMPAQQVAEQLGMSPHAVRLAKARVMLMLREEAHELLE